MEQVTEKKNTFFRFEDLRIYHKALDYIKWSQKSLAEASLDGSQNVSKHFMTSSRNIALNIAEGSARNKNQFIYYLKMAKSAVRECLVLTTILRNTDIWDEINEEYSRSQLIEMTKMLGALITSLQRSNSGNPSNNNNDDRDYNSY